MKNCLKFYQQYKDQYECEKGSTRHGALANILICLERAVQDGNYVHVLIDTIETRFMNHVFCSSVGSTASRKSCLKQWRIPSEISPAGSHGSYIH